MHPFAKTGGRGVLLYNLPETTEKGKSLRKVLEELNLSAADVKAWEVNEKVGFLAGMAGFSPSPKEKRQKTQGAPKEDLMLMCSLREEEVDSLFEAMKREDIDQGRKAMVTQVNKGWAFKKLVREVACEHDLMSAEAPAAEAPSEGK